MFLTAAIYLCLARIIVIYGKQYARFAPRTYTIIFICCDVFSLILQATGGGMADTAATPSQGQTGINIMIAGLSFQVVSLTLFTALCADFAWNVRKARDPRSPLQATTSRANIHKFLYGEPSQICFVPGRQLISCSDFSTRGSNHYHLYKILLSCSRIARRLQRHSCKRGGSFHDSGRCNGHHSFNIVNRGTSWTNLWEELGGG